MLILAPVEVVRERDLSRALPESDSVVPLARYVIAHAPDAERGLAVVGHIHRTRVAERDMAWQQACKDDNYAPTRVSVR